jgi:hypothetical protein
MRMPFREAIGGVARHRPVFVHRSDINDPTTTALFDHLLSGELPTEEGALQVYVEHLVVLLLGGVQHRGTAFDSGIVHHDVNTPQPGDYHLATII